LGPNVTFDGGGKHKKVEQTAFIILTCRDGKDPFLIDNHASTIRGNAFDCPEISIWDDDSNEEALVPEQRLVELEAAPGFSVLECQACAHLYSMWSRIIEASDDECTTKYGHQVITALMNDEYLRDFNLGPNTLTLDEWLDVKLVRNVMRRIEGQKVNELNEQAKHTKDQRQRR
jgi:hypothetical protein